MRLKEYFEEKSSGNGALAKAYGLAARHYEVLVYVFFGVITTAIDWTVRFFLYKTSLNIHVTDIIAWTLAVLFAFVTNRSFVFKSERKGFASVFCELFGFAAGRVFSLLVQEILMYIANGVLKLSPTAVMIPISVLVVIINYIFGKLLFKNNKQKKEKTSGSDKGNRE